MTGENRLETNTIIAALPNREGQVLAALCHHMPLERGDILCELDQELENAYFPTSGVLSLATVLGRRPPLELGLVGRDGILGATLSLGLLAAPMRAVVLVKGTALVMAASQLDKALGASLPLRVAVHHYQYRLMMQTLQTAACLHFHEIEPRLARWLLMVRELSLTDNVQCTHAGLSHALGVRRSGVSIAAGSLQRRGLINYSRGQIHIADTAGLENAACECHIDLNNRYHSLFGQDSGGAPVAPSRK